VENEELIKIIERILETKQLPPAPKEEQQITTSKITSIITAGIALLSLISSFFYTINGIDNRLTELSTKMQVYSSHIIEVDNKLNSLSNNINTSAMNYATLTETLRGLRQDIEEEKVQIKGLTDKVKK